VNPRELAAFAAVEAPTGAEQGRIAWLERRLGGLPGDRRRDAAGNLVWRSSAGRPGLLVLAHVDTVFAAGTPLDIHLDGGSLVGPGVGDNAAAVMALVWDLERRSGPPPGVAVAFTVGEEGLGNLRGAVRACTDLRPLRAIAFEGHGIDEVVVDHVGSVRVRVSVRGPGGHSWADRGTPSAIHGLVEVAGGLLDHGVNIGMIGGGRAVNAIADRAELVVERRSTDAAELDAFDRVLDGLAVDPPLALTVELLGRRPGGRIDREHPLVHAVLEARRRVGLGDRFGAGSTDANAAIADGIPALAVGCARGAGMHTPAERIDLESLVAGCAQVQAILDTAWGAADRPESGPVAGP